MKLNQETHLLLLQKTAKQVLNLLNHNKFSQGIPIGSYLIHIYKHFLQLSNDVLCVKIKQNSFRFEKQVKRTF
jgi:hypothetical protein